MNNYLIKWNVQDLVYAASFSGNDAYRQELERRAGNTGSLDIYMGWSNKSLEYQLTLAKQYSKTTFFEPQLQAKWGLAQLDINKVLVLRGKEEEVVSPPAATDVEPEEDFEVKLRGKYTIVNLEQSGEYTIVNLRLMKN